MTSRAHQVTLHRLRSTHSAYNHSANHEARIGRLTTGRDHRISDATASIYNKHPLSLDIGEHCPNTKTPHHGRYSSGSKSPTSHRLYSTRSVTVGSPSITSAANVISPHSLHGEYRIRPKPLERKESDVVMITHALGAEEDCNATAVQGDG